MPLTRPWLILAACALASLPALAGEKTDAPPLAPPPEPARSPIAPLAENNVTLAPLPDISAASEPKPVASVSPAEKIPTDGGVPDSAPPRLPKAKPDVDEETLACFKHVDDLRKRHDPVLAIDYLKQIVTSGTVLPQDRSRAIIELADVLEERGETAESLCWLKIWGEMFPARPEFAAVAYRVASVYSRIGMPDLARDAYYLSLGHAVNQGQMKTGDDLAAYNKLTTATLWGMAANEYQAGQWARGAELFQRYRTEANAATPRSLEKAAFLQADCYYQLRQAADAIKLYDETLTKYPFNPLAPQARLRLYHLYMVKGAPEKAQEELESLIWTVRTAYPKDEAYWKKETAQLLLTINQKNAEVLPPLVKQSAQLPPEGKSWQDALNHYDALVSYQVVKTHAVTDRSAGSVSKAADPNTVEEQNDLLAMNSRLNQLLPPPAPAPTP
jgi:tetratricopeptide (TPR) repeat protein